MDTNIPVLKPNGGIIAYDDFVSALVKKFMPANHTVQELCTKLEIAHTAIGIHTEAAEVADILKSHAIYGKPLDRQALIKEMGDLQFWIQDIQTKFGISNQEITQGNGKKLMERYSNLTFSDVEALHRTDKKWVIAKSFAHAISSSYIAGPFEHAYEVERYRDHMPEAEAAKACIFNLDDVAAEIERLDAQAAQ